MIPVDVYIPGCACRPEALIDGFAIAVAEWSKRVAKEENKGQGGK